MNTNLCQGPISRRSFLTLGTLGMSGLALGDVMQVRASQGRTPAPDTSVIFIWLAGGPPHMDMYDMKPDAPEAYRGQFRPIRTNVPGIDACAVGGDSWIYQFGYRDGSNVGSAPLVGAKPTLATKVTGRITVGAVVVRLPNRLFKGIYTDATGAKQPFTINVGGDGGVGRRVSWREVVR